MKQWFVSCLIFWTCSSEILTSTSTLIERIRQSEEADNPRGLDLTAEGWVHVPQSLQDVLSSIDDKLRSLDTFGYTLKLAKFDFSLEQLVRRLESIETKIGRLETKFDLRMEKVEEVVIGKDLKEEFSNEHLSRRMDYLNGKLNNKAAYLDAKIDLKMERVTTKLEILERDLHNLVDDIMDKLVKSDEKYSQFETLVHGKFTKVDNVAASVNDLRLYLKEEMMSVLQTRMDKVDQSMEELIISVHQNKEQVSTVTDSLTQTNVKIDRIASDLQLGIANITAKCGADVAARNLDLRCEPDAATQEQMLEALASILQKSIKSNEDVFRKLEANIDAYAKKTVANIQELRKISEENRSLLSKIVENGNRGRDVLRQEFRERLEQTSRCENKLSLMGTELDKKVTELSSTVDTSFASLLIAQNTFISTCKRIQEDENQVYEILQQIVYEMRNRSITDLHKISTEIRQNKVDLSASVAHLLQTLYFVGNHTSHQIEKYRSGCANKRDRGFGSVSHHPTTPSNKTRNYDSLSTNAVDPFDDTNEFHDIGNDTELDRTADDNATLNSLGDYENDYPIADAEYQ